LVSGSGLTFGNANSANSTVTGLVAGNTYTLRWTITNAPCASTFDEMTVTRQASAIPTVTIAASANPSCTGSTVNFTIASITNEGLTPTYQWKLNGTNIPGATGTSYSSSTLVTGDQITLTFVSSLACASPSAASSNTVNMSVSPIPTTANAGPNQTVCGTTATLAANTPTAGTGSWSVISGTATVQHLPVRLQELQVLWQVAW
jgi:hypothetical protein